VVAEARTWIGTKYHHMARVKGAGTDCLMLLAEVYEACGIIPHLDVPFYPADWNLHRNAELYLAGVMQHAREYYRSCGLRDTADGKSTCWCWNDTPDGGDISCAARGRLKAVPEPGDVALFKFGRCYAHGAIITEWPRLIHAWVGVGVLEDNAETRPELAKQRRQVRFFDPF
jgi:cell wall-associated NlpC family hydrolase